jgi:PhnB protein
MARTSIYLNFPGNTEDAFNFYKSVFGGEFGNDGIARFGDMPNMEGAPPMNDVLKSMIVHVELEIIGGLILMGTDAPEEMGFSVIQGNNVSINLEPDTREEADRLFNALSDGAITRNVLGRILWTSSR